VLEVGLTGNIGSGKTTVGRVFEVLNVPVFRADSEGHSVLNLRGVNERIADHFGMAVLDPNGKVDRAKLSGLVFSDPKALDYLNGLVHPRVRQAYAAWKDRYASAPMVMYEAAILFEGGFYTHFTKVICVAAPLELRIARIAGRDGATREGFMQREARQWPQEKKMEMADYIIRNDEVSPLIPQVLDVYHHLLGITPVGQL
jgi:dephospho-CoA kinase